MSWAGTYDASKTERVLLGARAAHAIAVEAARLDRHSVFLICSGSLDATSGICDAAAVALGARFTGAFKHIGAHSPRNDVVAAALEARAAKADLLVSIGGGSQIDGAKVIQFCLDANLQSEDELLAYALRPEGPAPSKSIPEISTRAIAIPTTLSGAEFSQIGGLSDPESGAKEGYLSPGFSPQSIIFDEELALHTPIDLWLTAAIRSLDHAAEGLCAPNTYPYLDECFKGAIRLLAKALPAAKADPSDPVARALGFQAVWTVSAGIGRVVNGASHGLGYVLGGFGVAHGHTSCVLLPAVLKWNEPVNEARQRPIAEALGRPGVSASEAVREFVKSLGLPTRLSEVGIAEEHRRKIAETGAAHSVVAGNPRPVGSPEDVLEILALSD